ALGQVDVLDDNLRAVHAGGAAVLRTDVIEREVADRRQALDYERVSGRDVDGRRREGQRVCREGHRCPWARAVHASAEVSIQPRDGAGASAARCANALAGAAGAEARLGDRARGLGGAVQVRDGGEASAWRRVDRRRNTGDAEYAR